jgi:hypothetical protein
MPYSNFNLKRVKNELNVNMTAWQFLRLKENDVEVDLKEYFIDNPGKIVGILSAMVEQRA